MIYLCSPYTDPDPAIVEQRFEAACRAVAGLIREGKMVFSPIAHSHAICRYGLPGDWEFWERHDLKHLAVCDQLVVLKLDGWQQSCGVQAEIAVAQALGKPVSFLAVDAQAEENPGRSRS
jgi:nucleoside 2-deoxyribosyltransferase